MPTASSPILPPASENAVEALYATGYWLFMQRRTAHALAVFRGLVHLAPRDERGWLALGACYEAQEQPDHALALYEWAAQMHGGAPRCEVARARILRSRGHVLQARGALAEAARIAHETHDEELGAIVATEWTKRT
jgi:tetratricopeptide (TPR) repeat protein